MICDCRSFIIAADRSECDSFETLQYAGVMVSEAKKSQKAVAPGLGSDKRIYGHHILTNTEGNFVNNGSSAPPASGIEAR